MNSLGLYLQLSNAAATLVLAHCHISMTLHAQLHHQFALFFCISDFLREKISVYLVKCLEKLRNRYLIKNVVITVLYSVNIITVGDYLVNRLLANSDNALLLVDLPVALAEADLSDGAFLNCKLRQKLIKI